MTLPDERYRAVMWAERFLQDLAHDYKKYPRIPKTVRQEAYSILRHYPNSWDLKRLEQAAPEVVCERMDDLHKMIVQWGQTTQRDSDVDKSGE
jgi:hypothetical protein